MSAPLIQIVLGSTRQGRVGEKVARWFADIASERTDIRVELVDLLDFPLPFFDSPMSPKRGLSDDPRIQAWADKISQADGFVLVTPEYNYGYPAVLKNALDHLYYQWNDKAVSFVGYGGVSGGLRAVQQLRQVVVELGMVQTHTQVTIPMAPRLFDEDGQLLDKRFDASAAAVLDEIADWARLLRTKREQLAVSA